MEGELGELKLDLEMGSKLWIGDEMCFFLNLDGLQGPSVPLALSCCTHSGRLLVDGVLVSLDMDCYAILHIHLLYGVRICVQSSLQ